MAIQVIEGANAYTVEISNPLDKQIIKVIDAKWGVMVRSVVRNGTYTVIVDYGLLDEFIAVLQDIRNNQTAKGG